MIKFTSESFDYESICQLRMLAKTFSQVGANWQRFEIKNNKAVAMLEAHARTHGYETAYACDATGSEVLFIDCTKERLDEMTHLVFFEITKIRNQKEREDEDNFQAMKRRVLETA